MIFLKKRGFVTTFIQEEAPMAAKMTEWGPLFSGQMNKKSRMYPFHHSDTDPHVPHFRKQGATFSKSERLCTPWKRDREAPIGLKCAFWGPVFQMRGEGYISCFPGKPVIN